MVTTYQHDIAAWMDGTEGLSDGEYRAYHVICELLYLNNGPIIAHESGIAGRCNQHVLAFRANLKKLVAKGKVYLNGDGKIANRRVDSELKKMARTPSRPPPDPSRTSAQPPGGLAAKPLKNIKPAQESLLLSSTDLESVEDSEELRSSALVEDVRTKLFRGGLATLARMSGRPPDRLRSMLGRWLRNCHDDAVVVARAIEDAERNQVADPVPWIERALENRGGMTNGRTSGIEAADRLLRREEERASRALCEDDHRLLPQRPIR